MTRKTYTEGQKVRTCYGTLETVRRQDGCQVWTEEAGPNTWYHPEKLVAMYWSKTIGRFVTVPA